MKFVSKGLFACAAVVFAASAAAAQTAGTWSFAVSGDSRNCGDIIMPAIAPQVIADHAEFYWHLGDFRALYDFDQDMLAARHGKMVVHDYENQAWPDFIDQQLAAFKNVPVFLGVGNHELVGKTHADVLIQFADWFDAPVLRQQRLADDPSNHKLQSYNHWHQHNVDFITLDNASPDQFDAEQVAWLEKVLKRDEQDGGVQTVVVGMHEALPDSLASGHSMNESPMGAASGRKVYQDLVDFRKRSGKEVQVLASHSHFLMQNVYNTSCRKPEDVLPGWIVGTAGAVRYRLPTDHAGSGMALTDIYGYLLGTVSANGHVTFSFHAILPSDIPEGVKARYGTEAVTECFEGNRSNYTPEGSACEVK